MDWKIKKELLEKYWKGETSLEEEAWLKANVSDLELETNTIEAKYLDQLNQFSDLSMDEAFEMADIVKEDVEEAKLIKVPFYKSIRKVAAAILILVSLGLGMNSVFNIQPVEEVIVEQSPEEAFEVAKQALLLISSKLNKGIDCANEFSKFNQTTEKIETRKIN